MLIDSHCHLDCLDLKPYGGSFDAFMAATREQDVHHMLCVSINWEDYPAMRDLVQDYSNVSISVGVHPNERDGHDPSEDELIQQAKADGAVAIGETGLDYYRTDAEMAWQHNRFRTHIRAAKSLQKPIIIHTRQAQGDTIRIMAEEQAGETGGVMHCFTEVLFGSRPREDSDDHVG